jgi:coenzyme F420-reducing hydrogenase alpha subunit
MSAVHAMEDAFGVRVEGPIRDLRRLVYCGEWIESHALHVYMLHAPDFLGFPDAIQMAREHPKIVQRGLQLKKAGNEVISLLGGREIHPINVRVGGFYRVPTRNELAPLAERMKRARDMALETVKWVAQFPFPEFEQDYVFVSLSHPEEYPFNEGRLVSNRGLDISVHDYDDNFVEEHVAYSHALHSVLKAGTPYFVGPLARYNLNFDRLSPIAQEAARSAGLGPECRNPFQSIIVRSIEILHACDEAVRLIERYEPPDKPRVPIHPHAARGYACTEAPRGTLYHRYRIDENGIIREAKIVPPTSQNQKTIEQDLWQFIPKHFQDSQNVLRWQCEQAIRNYDPCISCATHFLRLEWREE